MAETRITVRNNGPLFVEGDNIVLSDQEGGTYKLAGRTLIKLCRCGQSTNKPFCDGSHNRTAFASECRAVELPPPPPPKAP